MIYDTLKQLRLSKAWTQEDLAEKLNVTRQTISKWEQGINEPDIATLLKLSELFEVSMDELLGKEVSNQTNHFPYVMKILNVVSISICIWMSLLLVVSIWYLKDRIPMHYNWAGQIDRWGSKWEWLFMLIYFISIVATDLCVSYFLRKDTQSKTIKITFISVKIICWCCQIAGIGMFFGLAGQFLKKEYLLQLINCAAYAFLLSVFLIGHPAIIKRNKYFGIVKTNFTCSNDLAWYKVNRFAWYIAILNCLAVIGIQLCVTHFWWSFVISYMFIIGFLVVGMYYVQLKRNLK